MLPSINIAADVFEIGSVVFADWLLRMKEAGCNVVSDKGSYQGQEIDILNEIVKTITEFAGATQFLHVSQNEVVFEAKDVFLTMREGHGSDDIVVVNLHGDEALVQEIKAALDTRLTVFRSSSIHWWYMGSGNPTSIRMAMAIPKPFEPLMYPSKAFGGDPLGYMQEYYKSGAAILFLLGPPGTGKTSLIRQFLWENELNAAVTYDEKVMRSDGMFIEFIGGGHRRRGSESPDILVLEDVTELLTSREMDKNEMMARFLNVSDGLIQPPNKKIIFTTNLVSLKDVDPALLRVGRCHDVVEMRPLFYEEAVSACKSTGLPIPLEKRDYLMSELYNQGKAAHQVNKVGYR